MSVKNKCKVVAGFMGSDDPTYDFLCNEPMPCARHLGLPKIEDVTDKAEDVTIKANESDFTNESFWKSISKNSAKIEAAYDAIARIISLPVKNCLRTKKKG